jgi:hypothetical protein
MGKHRTLLAAGVTFYVDAQTPLVTLAIWGAAGCLLAIAAAAVRVNYRSLYERFARRNRTVLRPRLLSPAD